MQLRFDEIFFQPTFWYIGIKAFSEICHENNCVIRMLLKKGFQHIVEGFVVGEIGSSMIYFSSFFVWVRDLRGETRG